MSTFPANPWEVINQSSVAGFRCISMNSCSTCMYCQWSDHWCESVVCDKHDIGVDESDRPEEFLCDDYEHDGGRRKVQGEP